jgi:hypothetical protein
MGRPELPRRRWDINSTRTQFDLLKKAIGSTLDLLMASRTSVYVIDPTVNTKPIPEDPVSNIANPNVITQFASDDPSRPLSASWSL